MTQNKEAIEALDWLQSNFAYTLPCDVVDKKCETIRTTLMDDGWRDVDVEALRHQYYSARTDTIKDTIDYILLDLHKRGLIRGCGCRSVKQQMDDLQTLSEIRTPPKGQKQ